MTPKRWLAIHSPLIALGLAPTIGIGNPWIMVAWTAVIVWSGAPLIETKAARAERLAELAEFRVLLEAELHRDALLDPELREQGYDR